MGGRDGWQVDTCKARLTRWRSTLACDMPGSARLLERPMPEMGFISGEQDDAAVESANSSGPYCSVKGGGVGEQG
jgi:hypothetical protein